MNPGHDTAISLTEMQNDAIAGKIGSVTINGTEATGKFKDGKESFHTTIPQNYPDLYNDLHNHGVDVTIKDQNGTLWLNIGDSYTSGNRGWRAPDRKNVARAMSTRPPTPEGLKPKDLIGVPWRLAFALQERGWYLRSDLVWNKPNAQPESVGDRPTRSHEYLFLLSKSEKYVYDVDAVRGPNDRRLRSVWDLNTQPSREASGHFATFPESLAERCILIGTRPGDLVLDPFLGSGTTAVAATRNDRRFLGLELNPEYVAMAARRLGGVS